MAAKTKAVKRSKTKVAPTYTLAELRARFELRSDALKLVEQLALYTVDDPSPDEPGATKEAFELLIKHGYRFVMTAPAKLRRPDGSEVTR